MMPVMRSPEGLYVNVPDDADPKELESLGLKPQAASQPAAQAPSRTPTEQLLRQLGLSARMAVHGFTGTSGALSNLAVGGINAVAGTHIPTPTVEQEKLLNRFLPQPENDAERAVQGVGSVLAGGMLDPFMGGAARASREMVPEGFQMAAKQMSPEMMKHIETLGSVFGGGTGAIAGNKLGGLLGGGIAGYAGSKFGRAGGEALANALAKRMMLNPTPFMGNSPNMARYVTQMPVQWLTPREEDRPVNIGSAGGQW